jgi:hypothetical protein
MDNLNFLTKEERFILDWTGIILLGIGIFTFIFTLNFDQIARGETQTTIGWIQGLGLLLSIGLGIFGFLVDGWLRWIKIILKDYVKR